MSHMTIRDLGANCDAIVWPNDYYEKREVLMLFNYLMNLHWTFANTHRKCVYERRCKFFSLFVIVVVSQSRCDIDIGTYTRTLIDTAVFIIATGIIYFYFYILCIRFISFPLQSICLLRMLGRFSLCAFISIYMSLSASQYASSTNIRNSKYI